MAFFIVTGDITKMQTDAIVNAANKTLLGGGGVDGAIHKAAGRELYEECKTLGGCETGEAKLTRGYKLASKYVIHTVGPVWNGGSCGERELLYSCFYNSLMLALKNDIRSIAFPLISSGAYGYPKNEAIEVAHEAIRNFLDEHDMTVYLVLYNKRDFVTNAESIALKRDIDAYLERGYIPANIFHAMAQKRDLAARSIQRDVQDHEKMHMESVPLAEASAEYIPETCKSLSDIIGNLDMNFSEMLLKLIDERHMTDAQCYKAANIDRRLFSKIRNDSSYHPTKRTCIAFAIALKLDLDSMQVLLRSAGYTLTHSSRFDVIIEYFVTHGIYDIYVINDTLFEYDEVLLGA